MSFTCNRELTKNINQLVDHLSHTGAEHKSSGLESTAADYQLCIDVINQLTDALNSLDLVDEVNIPAFMGSTPCTR